MDVVAQRGKPSRLELDEAGLPGDRVESDGQQRVGGVPSAGDPVPPGGVVQLRERLAGSPVSFQHGSQLDGRILLAGTRAGWPGGA